MIMIDPRTGSGELAHRFEKHGIPTDLSQELPAGDFAFRGNGPKGADYFIGVERKALADLLKSSYDGRLTSGQMPSLCSPLFDRAYIIVEGVFRCGTDGILEVMRGKRGGKTNWVPMTMGTRRFMYSEYSKFIIGLQEFTPVVVMRTSSEDETVKTVIDTYNYWNSKVYEQHSSHNGKRVNHVEITPWSFLRRVCVELPGVGERGSKAFENYFKMGNKGLEWLMKVDEQEFSNIQIPSGSGTKRLGKVAAQRIWKELHGE
jgi:ERCC4-type nuclease